MNNYTRVPLQLKEKEPNILISETFFFFRVLEGKLERKTRQGENGTCCQEKIIIYIKSFVFVPERPCTGKLVNLQKEIQGLEDMALTLGPAIKEIILKVMNKMLEHNNFCSKQTKN